MSDTITAPVTPPPPAPIPDTKPDVPISDGQARERAPRETFAERAERLHGKAVSSKDEAAIRGLTKEAPSRRN
jgi:hypothetical protein